MDGMALVQASKAHMALGGNVPLATAWRQGVVVRGKIEEGKKKGRKGHWRVGLGEKKEREEREIKRKKRKEKKRKVGRTG